MDIRLIKFFLFRRVEALPYCTDLRGGNVFHGVGSHVLFSDLKNCDYRLALEVVTIDQPDDVHIERTTLTFSCDDRVICTDDLNWPEIEGAWRLRTAEPRYSAYQWTQWATLDLEKPSLVTVDIDVKFDDSPEPRRLAGNGSFLVDLHLRKPPKFYGRLRWLWRVLRGKRG